MITAKTNSDGSDLSRLKRFFRVLELFTPFPFKIGSTLALSVVSGGCEAGAIMSLMPVLQQLSSGETSPVFARIGSWLGLTQQGYMESILLSITLFLGLGILSAIARYLAQNGLAEIEFSIVSRAMSRTSHALLGSRWEDFLRLRSGESHKAMLLEAHRIGQGAKLFLMAISEGFVVLLMGLMCAFVSWRMTLWSLLFGLVGTFFYLLLGRGVQKRSSGLAEVESRMSELVGEVFGNLKSFRLSGNLDDVRVRLDQEFSSFGTQGGDIQKSQNRIRLSVEIGAIIFIAFFVGFGALFLKVGIPSLLIFLAIFYRLVPRIIGTNTYLIAAEVEMRMYRAWKRRLEATELKAVANTGDESVSFQKEVVIQDLTLQHSERDQPTLLHVQLNIPKNSFVGIVGASGSGKTSLIDMIAGLFEPSTGAIQIDGKNLTESNRKNWQGKIAIVEQSTPVFFGTLKENIAWRATTVNDALLRECIRLAHLEGLVQRLPKGIEGIVGKGGSPLSGGEAQRLGLARALYRQPEVLILDEATSALDLEAERHVMQAIHGLRGKCTIIMISHRLHTVQECDEIVVIEAGKITQRGKWQALTAHQGGYFAKIMSMQEHT